MISRQRVPWHAEEDRKKVQRLKEQHLQHPERLFTDQVWNNSFWHLVNFPKIAATRIAGNHDIPDPTPLRGPTGLRLDETNGSPCRFAGPLHTSAAL